MNLIDKHGLLEPEQTDVLSNRVIANFTLGKYNSLDEILTNLGVNVIIEPGTVTRSIPSELEEAEKYWKNRWEQLRKNENAGEERSEAANNMERVPDEIKELKSMPLRGLYDPSANVIKLYPQEMAKEYGGNNMDELLLSTLAHETMHAYFNRESRKNYPYVYFVEEPLAEFGMLLYLSENYESIFNWALSDVKGKKTCYKYGATLMKMHKAEKKTDSTIRKYLEDYKIKLDLYDMPTLDSKGGKILLPSKPNSPILVKGQLVSRRWKDVFDNPPRYFWDDATKTLGLDGEWGHFHRKRFGIGLFIDVDIDIHHFRDNQIQQIYLGDSFSTDNPERLLSEAPVYVSPKNKVFKSIKGIPVFRKDNTPALRRVGNGYFRLCRNGKWGVIDAQLNEIVSFKYDYIWPIDENGLFKVEIDKLRGLVDTKGNEQVPVI